MPPLKILIIGAGIAGNTLAYWLSTQHHNHTITVIERFPSLRATGLQLDLRGPGIEVMRRMGLETEFRARSVKEDGMAVVDSAGRRWAFFPANRSGEGLQSFSTDYEIMRGDLCELLYEKVKDRLGARYVFGEWVRCIEQGEKGVDVTFSDGRKERFDLVVGADGQGSRTRRMILAHGEKDPFHPLGHYAGYFTIPRERAEGEGNVATMYLTSGSRFVMTRRHQPGRIQAYLMYGGESERMKNSDKGDVEEEKRAFAEVYRGAGWESDRLLEALEHADDFYCDRMGFVKMDSWSRGRVVLVGDAAYSASAMTGMGTTSGMVGAYLLAGEIGKYCGEEEKESDGDGTVALGSLKAALKAYEDKFRPFMDQVQEDLSDEAPLWLRILNTRMGIAFLYGLVAVASFLRLDVIASWFLKEDVKKWDLPDYPVMVNP